MDDIFLIRLNGLKQRKKGIYYWAFYFVFVLIILLIGIGSIIKIETGVTCNGIIRPKKDIQFIQSPNSGLIDTLFCHEGDTVKAGDTLLIFTSTELNQKKEIITENITKKLEFSKSLQNLKINIENLQSNLPLNDLHQSHLFDYKINNALLIADYKEKETYFLREKKLFESEVISKAEFENSSSKLLTSSYNLQKHKLDELAKIEKEFYENLDQLRELEEEIALINYSISKLVIIAPISGVIGNCNVHGSNEYIISDSKLFELLPNDGNQIELWVDNKEINKIRLNQKMNFFLKSFSLKNNNLIKGSIYYISPNVFENTSYYKVLANIESSTELNNNIFFKIGMSGEGKIIVEEKTILSFIIDKIFSMV